MGGESTACLRPGVISVVMRQAVMGHERLFCSGARRLNLWIPPTSSADESHHYALDGRVMAGGDPKWSENADGKSGYTPVAMSVEN